MAKRPSSIRQRSAIQTDNNGARFFERLDQLSLTVPLRHDFLILLDYVQRTKVVGTASTGNMPRRAIREVTAKFTNPPELDRKIGDNVYTLRTEYDVRQLFYLHSLAVVGGFMKTPKGKPWRVTRIGKDFQSMPAFAQLWDLLSVWWFETNWLLAYPVEGLGERLPPHFRFSSLLHLRGLPVSRDIPFEEFADGLIASTGLTWRSEDKTLHTMMLRTSIMRIVLNVLENFGMVHLKYREKVSKGSEYFPDFTFKELVSFRITELGDALLLALLYRIEDIESPGIYENPT